VKRLLSVPKAEIDQYERARQETPVTAQAEALIPSTAKAARRAEAKKARQTQS
jgi:hypothetical protein